MGEVTACLYAGENDPEKVKNDARKKREDGWRDVLEQLKEDGAQCTIQIHKCMVSSPGNR